MISARLQEPTMVWAQTCQEASLALRRGESDRAEELATQALEIGSASEEPDAFTWYGSQLMVVRDQQGRLAELVDLIADVAEQTPGMPVYRAVLRLGAPRVRATKQPPECSSTRQRSTASTFPKTARGSTLHLLREHRRPAPACASTARSSSLSLRRTTTR